MSGPTTADLMKDALARLKSADPEAYDLFLQVFDLYSIECMHGMTKAPQDQILNAQGRAQQCQALLRMATEAKPYVARTQPQPPASAP